jgi:hypothetical protein
MNRKDDEDMSTIIVNNESSHTSCEPSQETTRVLNRDLSCVIHKLGQEKMDANQWI